MSLKLFEQFLQTEITRNPGLVNSLKWKGGGLRRCSQLFDEAVADLHYRLVRRAIQLLFTRTNAARLRQLSVACEASCGSCSGGPAAGDGFVGSSCETKDPGSDSSRMTANSQHNINCSPGSRYTSQSVDVAFDNNETRWEGQSNNSQNFRQAPQRSPARQSGASLGCCRISAGNVCGNNSRWTTRAKDTKQQPAQQHLCPPQYPQQTQQSQQEQQQPPAVERKASCCSGPAPELLKPPTPPPPRRQPQPDVVEPPTEAAIVREGPAYNYPTANRHNRQTMAGWYVANMDALLSNLMRQISLE